MPAPFQCCHFSSGDNFKEQTFQMILINDLLRGAYLASPLPLGESSSSLLPSSCYPTFPGGGHGAAGVGRVGPGVPLRRHHAPPPRLPAHQEGEAGRWLGGEHRVILFPSLIVSSSDFLLSSLPPLIEAGRSPMLCPVNLWARALSLNGPGLDERSFLDYPKGKQIELTV